MTLDRLSILKQVRPLHKELVEIPEWGGGVHVRVLTGKERDELEQAWETTKRKNFRARLAVAVCCDDDGNDVFQYHDIEALGQQPSTALQRITEVALRINGFSREAREDLEKNSESGPGGDS